VCVCVYFVVHICEAPVAASPPHRTEGYASSSPRHSHLPVIEDFGSSGSGALSVTMAITVARDASRRLH